jgi:hypothetical protein
VLACRLLLVVLLLGHPVVDSPCSRLLRVLWIEVIVLGAQGFVLTLRPLFALSAFCQ